MKTKPTKSWHWADVEKSDRLKRVVKLLRDNAASIQCYRVRKPFSAREISWYACVNSGPSVLAELRKNAVDIKSKKVKGFYSSYMVYWIEK